MTRIPSAPGTYAIIRYNTNPATGETRVTPHPVIGWDQDEAGDTWPVIWDDALGCGHMVTSDENRTILEIVNINDGSSSLGAPKLITSIVYKWDNERS